jgi:hypothetical protein
MCQCVGYRGGVLVVRGHFRRQGDQLTHVRSELVDQGVHLHGMIERCLRACLRKPVCGDSRQYLAALLVRPGDVKRHPLVSALDWIQQTPGERALRQHRDDPTYRHDHK